MITRKVCYGSFTQYIEILADSGIIPFQHIHYVVSRLNFGVIGIITVLIVIIVYLLFSFVG